MPKTAAKPKPPASLTGCDIGALTQQQAASLIGRPVSWVRDNSHLWERVANGRYDGRQVVAAYVEHALQQHGHAGDEKALKLAEIKARTDRDESQAAKNWVAVETAKGNLIDRQDVEAVIRTILAASSERLVQIADKVAPSIPQDIRAEIVGIIRADTGKALTALHEDLRRRVVPSESEAA